MKFIIAFVYNTYIEGGRMGEGADWPVTIARILVDAGDTEAALKLAARLKPLVVERCVPILPWLTEDDIMVHLSTLDSHNERCERLAEELMKLADKREAEQAG